jgi:hypothetical protein
MVPPRLNFLGKFREIGSLGQMESDEFICQVFDICSARGIAGPGLDVCRSIVRPE